MLDDRSSGDAIPAEFSKGLHPCDIVFMIWTSAPCDPKWLSATGETRCLTRFPNMGHTPCVMNLPPTTINMLSSKAFAVTWNLRRSRVSQPFTGIESESMSLVSGKFRPIFRRDQPVISALRNSRL
jgi:hypothetical protein